MLTHVMTELNDTALMLRYRDGDLSAFNTLYERHRGSLFRFLVRRVGNQTAAEDLFQDVWSRVIQSRRSYRPTAKFSTYLFRIARNRLIDHYRSSGRKPPTESTAEDTMNEPAAITGDPETELSRRELQASLAAALAALPDEQSEAFLLHEEAGFTLAEIGGLTGVGRETVKSRLRYAVTKLRQAIPSHLDMKQHNV